MPLWIWPPLFIAAILVLCWLDIRQQKRNRQNWNAIRAEHQAREAAKPLGNAERWYG